MPADIESIVTGSNQVPWHRLGPTFEGLLTPDEAMLHARLSGWDVKVTPIHDVNFGKLDNVNMVTRVSPITGEREPLYRAIVSDDYATFQNEDLNDWVKAVLSLTGDEQVVDSAGSLKGGTRVFMACKMPDKGFTIDPQGAADESETYVLFTVGHDGTLAIIALLTTVRVVCSNTHQMALQNAQNMFKIKHTANHATRLMQARTVLNVGFAWVDRMKEEATELYQASVTDAEFFDIVSTVWERPDEDASKRSHTVWEKKVDSVFGVWNEQKNAAIRNTGWGAFNAFTEFLDHKRTPKNGDRESMDADLAGFGTNVANKHKGEILSIVKELAVVGS